MEFQRHIEGADRARAIIGKRSCDVSEFLVQKIISLRHVYVVEVNVLGVRLLGGSERQLHRCIRAIRR